MSTTGRVQTPGYIPEKYPVGFLRWTNLKNPPKNPPRLKSNLIGVGDGGQGREIFFGQLLCKFGHFSGKNHVKFGNFVNHIYFWGQKCLAP